MKSKRFELTIPVYLLKLAKDKASDRGISLAEYIKDLMKSDLGGRNEKQDV